MATWGTQTMEAVGKGVHWPKCHECPKKSHQSARARWGCDEPAQDPVFHVICSSCHKGVIDGEECPDCGGTGEIPFFECPTKVVDGANLGFRRYLSSLLRLYIQYDSRNVLPYPGAYVDQPAYLLASFDIIDSQRGELQRLEEEKMKKAARRNELLGNKGQGRGFGPVHRPIR